jgi:hypothetical protein
MTKVHWGYLEPETPLMFTDGTGVYNRLSKDLVPHKRGYFIVAPSGTGKTYFLERQRENHWLDGDTLWEETNAHPKGPWWLDLPTAIEADHKSDEITSQAKKLGLWIIGASNDWLRPDAVVLPPWSTHKKYIKTREKESYDGGATSDMLPRVLNHRKWLRRWGKVGVPIFKSVQEAAEYLEKKYKEESR